jgi:Domain of unknown function (DUF4203)
MNINIPFNDTTVTLIGIGLIIAGVFSCFSGQRIFALFLALSGFVVGFSAGLSLTQNSPQQTMLFISAALGILGALIFIVLYGIGVIVAGVVLGLFVGWFLGTSLGFGTSLLIFGMIICALIGGVAGQVVGRIIIVAATALVGAGMMIYGALLLLGYVRVVQQGPNYVAILNTNVVSPVVLVVILGVLGLVGMASQLRRR